MWDCHIKLLSRLYASLPVLTCSKPGVSDCLGGQRLWSLASSGLDCLMSIFLCLAKLTSPLAPQYVKWAGAKGPDAFFTDKKARKLFKDHIDVVVNRRNSINGRLYKEVIPSLQSLTRPIRPLKYVRRAQSVAGV